MQVMHDSAFMSRHFIFVFTKTSSPLLHPILPRALSELCPLRGTIVGGGEGMATSHPGTAGEQTAPISYPQCSGGDLQDCNMESQVCFQLKTTQTSERKFSLSIPTCFPLMGPLPKPKGHHKDWTMTSLTPSKI